VRYSPDDVARSLQRYYAAMLGDNVADDESKGRWEWRAQREEVADDARPVAVLDMGAERVTAARTVVPQGNVTVEMPYTLTLYPPLNTPRVAGSFARKLAGHLTDALVIGIDLGVYVTTAPRTRPVAGPMRLPLWDYSATPLTGSGRAGPASPVDHLWVEDVSSHAIQDPADAQRWTVVSDVRLSWEKPGRVYPDGPLVDRLIPDGRLR
jgi:hypothetical protein